MNVEAKPLSKSQSDNVLLIGNNPIEMSKMIDTLAKVPGRTIVTEIAFDVKTILERLLKFTPNFILIDDNIGNKELSHTVHSLTHHRKTRNTPITVLKNSNYHQSITSADIMDYVLKQNLTPDSLYNSLKNSLKFKMARTYLVKVYRERRKQLLKLVH
jgi:hypothetical protein